MKEAKNIAVIGGGASGIISGYLLSENHEITIYEREAILGGNVRTLNRNVKGTTLPNDLNIENGVLGFSQTYYPNFHKLLDHLGTPYTGYKPSLSLFSDRQFYPARTKSYLNWRVLWNMLTSSRYRKELAQLMRSKKEFDLKLTQSSTEGLTFEDYNISHDLYKNYLKALFMLSFSTPFPLTPQLPQSILNPYVRSLPNSEWSFIQGGVYRYLEDILSKSKMRTICNAKSLKVERNAQGVTVKLQGEEHNYDKVIIATTPGSVKDLLIDMSDQENQIFKDWDDQTFRTVAHKDLSFYRDFKKVKKTPMDLFYQFEGSTVGYNTYQNTVYRLKTKDHYSFAHNLEGVIKKESLIDEANHIVPKYASDFNEKIRLLHEINGNQNTFFAGAYMGNGLQEGAVDSAMTISAELGGIRL